MTPQDFIAKWGRSDGLTGPAYSLNEEQGAQSHFLDLCELLDVPKPGSHEHYRFEEKSLVIGGKTGYCDVYLRGAFAWENKAPGKDLDKALKQLLTYSLALSNPPLLVVCDRLTIRIHTRFNGHPSEVHTVSLIDLRLPDKLALLRRVWLDPESFRPKETSRDITEAAAKSFAALADGLRRRGGDADDVAHFLTQCLFCFFAEDVGLLPGRLFEALVKNRRLTSERLAQGLGNLFTAMQGGGLYGSDEVSWFNGGLFKTIKVPALTVLDTTELRNAAALNWSAIDVSIFGTLFERGLDPAKRSQLGAHYTDPATIMRIVKPVIETPLLQLWEQTNEQIRGQLAKSTRKGDKNHRAAQASFITWLDALKTYRILDPACGSGNFLFLGLKTLKDIEHKSHLEAAAHGLDREADLVTGPHNVLGIELNEYAAELARVTVWIGELQWRMAHGYEFKTNPVLEPLDHIECRDALLVFEPSQDGAQAAVEAPWPKASVVVGNPPFLGGSKKRRELGDAYFDALDQVFKGRVPGGADLVCYWFEKARKAIETNGLGAAGLVATQSIRAGSNRTVLASILKTTRIFDAWSDEAWVNDGAAVRVSMVSFGWGDCCFLNGERVDQVTAELGGSADVDMTGTHRLEQNANASFEGTKKYGDFDVAGELGRAWLGQPNPHGRSNAEVVKPWRNGLDIAGRTTARWIVDFGVNMSEPDASLFADPFSHVLRSVKPVRSKTRSEQTQRIWWLHERTRPAMREATKNLPRFIVTPRVAKHRFFVYLDQAVLPDTRLNVIARADDATFGVLSSRIHEAWSLAQASMHGVGNDPTYNAKSCFETFPFPQGLTPVDTAHQRTETLDGGAVIPAGLSDSIVPIAPVNAQYLATKTEASAIAIAARHLNDLREAWLNPPEWTHRVKEVIPLGMTESPYPDRIEPKPGISEEDLKALQKRTLTNLYNQSPAWITMAHQQLDIAVAKAYGWVDYNADMPDEEILKRLLALNLQRSAADAGNAEK